VKLWTFPGPGLTRYVAVAHLGPHSSIGLVEPSGFTVACWRSGDQSEVVRGQWISTSEHLRLVLHGSALRLDVAAEAHRVEELCRRWGVRLPQLGAA
jgi:hypothetical protein